MFVTVAAGIGDECQVGAEHGERVRGLERHGGAEVIGYGGRPRSAGQSRVSRAAFGVRYQTRLR